MSGCSFVYLDRGDRLEDRRQPAADPCPCFCRLTSAERLLWKLSRIAMVHQRFCGKQSSGTFHRQEAKQNLVHGSECITISGLQVLGMLSAEREAISTAGQLPLPGPKANHRYQYDRWMNCLLLRLSLCRMVLTLANAAGAPRHMDTAFNDILAALWKTPLNPAVHRRF